MTPHVFRLTQGKDLRRSIEEYVKSSSITGGSLLSCVGCLSKASIRLADESKTLEVDGPLEIISLSGTLTPDHVHLHISVADKHGHVIGGHLNLGSMVSYTAEICLVSFDSLSLGREYDPDTGFTELVVLD
ncbi:DNA-binding protein [Vibrio sp. Of7-15]|uniref:PPC domain-containing DNA-binding protein n=1 Tax=Vibrio sp. Of7-15 TaxID=2724879 RepID=UPI001EF291E9|nr:PPC domain-containing DNA-binding protein [Vibrio sp. Of7-15]MCG7496327.1 DNA-binding protein [Vibrio sp. Of7-15]